MKTKTTVTEPGPTVSSKIDAPKLIEAPARNGLYIRLPGAALNEEQLRTHLTNMPEMSWVALNQLLASRQLQAVGDARDGHAAEQIYKAAGRIAENSELVGDLWRLTGRTGRKAED